MEIKLEFEYDDFFGVPDIKISLGDIILYNNSVKSEIIIDVELPEAAHQLCIEHVNKEITHTSQEHDRHIVIKRIWFDGVDLDQLAYNKLTHGGRFYPTYESSYKQTCAANGVELPEFICPNHYLGHNGKWILDFSYPALLWIIKLQNPTGINLEDTIFSTSSDVLNDIKNYFNLNV